MRTNTGTLAGRDVTSARNVEEAITLAELDWTVEQATLDAPDAPVSVDLSAFRANFYQPKDGSPPVTLGVVGKSYGVLQNAELMQPLDYLVREFGVSYHAAGLLRNGTAPYITLRAKSLDREVNGDVVEGWLHAKTSHDGTGSLSITARPTVLICSNGMRGVFKAGLARVTVRHTTHAVVDSMLGARLFREAEEQMDLVVRYAGLLEGRKLTPSEFRKAVANLYGDPNEEDITNRQRTIRENALNRAAQALQSTRGFDLSRDVPAWDAFQALTEADEWLRPVRGADDPTTHRARRTLEGANDKRTSNIARAVDNLVFRGPAPLHLQHA